MNNNQVRYAIVVEKSENGFGAYVPDLPGCAATGGTEAEVLAAIRTGIELYIEELKLRGQTAPVPTTRCTEIEVRSN
ncbi:MAG: type II toxin-antitoxin system HicB family antitoxin [Candidatus Binataceae bacterium]